MGYNGGIAMQHLASSPAVLQSQLHHLCPYCTRTHVLSIVYHAKILLL